LQVAIAVRVGRGEDGQRGHQRLDFRGSTRRLSRSGPPPCLRTIEKVMYLPHGDSPDWCNGFLSLFIRPTGKFFCTPPFIVGGPCEFNGVIASARPGSRSSAAGTATVGVITISLGTADAAADECARRHR
jgi:hypothetical protein